MVTRGISLRLMQRANVAGRRTSPEVNLLSVQHPGWDILDHVDTQRKIGVTELALRDAHQSLMATRMATEDMVGACADIDGAGFWSVECWGGATYDACIRFLNEDPWERLRTFRALMP